MNKNDSGELKIVREVENLEGRYTNYFKIGHNAYEIYIDFGQCSPENSEAVIFNRVIMSPVYTKTLFELLHKTLEDFDESYGEIE